MDTTVRPGLRTSFAAASITVAALALSALSAGTASAAPTPSTTGTPSYARAMNGQMVAVSNYRPNTPVHPEAITHPGLDSMGSTVAAHETSLAPAAVTPAAVPQLPGIDVSSYQGNINWTAVAPHIDFSYAKASEGTYNTNPDFTNQYNGPYNAGVIRGSYHFAIPNNSSGSVQADYFIAHGGGWSGDGKTLPGALDIEYNPYGAECYGLSQASMVSWIWSFVNEYAAREHAYPVIYTTTNWWSTCTGNNSGFAAYDPLWIANYSASGGGTLPSGWGYYTFWQYADSGSQPGDQDVFNGAYTQLQAIAAKG
ncbi:GH25 family lysozyme [Streptacidiphilus cavernicola]|uniref:GH25 family lysozyme n=1 Tax=Streptacidiphilus cavernicola TaxID=3342716 RepID=A0ABV6VPS2_9ACTN